MNHFWQICCAQLERELTPQQFKAWIKPLSVYSYSGDLLRIAAPNHCQQQWAQLQYRTRITELAKTYWNRETEIQIIIAPDLVQDEAGTYSNQALTTNSQTNSQNFIHASRHWLYEMPANTRKLLRSSTTGLNPDLSFDLVAVGKVNQYAYVLAKQVSGTKHRRTNPLLIHGEHGMGKTHLLHAIGNQFATNFPDARIRYIHADQFVREVVAAYQKGRFDEFRHSLQSLDLWLIDDIQFLAGKQRSQEEFLYALEALIARQKKIVIACNANLQQLTQMEPLLSAKIMTGLAVSLEAPDMDTRIAALSMEAMTTGIELPKTVAAYLSQSLGPSFRELLFGLNNVLAYSRFRTEELTLDLAKQALSAALSTSFIESRSTSPTTSSIDAH